MVSQQRSRTVIQRKNDPFIYLYVMGEWYCYNPLEPPIGSGAMGDVYRGYRCKNRAVIAVKRVKDYYANNKMIRERARQEASLAFRHPNLVEMIGYCEYAPDSGPIFILSNFVQGQNVNKYVQKFDGYPDRVEKICNVICSVLDALDYVHSRGVIHRDIKPSNIMIEEGANVRVMDLGIARMNSGNKFSSFGFIGTPEYSAPEQILREQNGNSVSINATTDFYALGITFYELLTGENPMNCQSEAETITKQMKEQLPSSPMIPRPLMRVIWKATEKDQASRYQSASEFKRAIQTAMYYTPTPWERFTTWIQENTIAFVSLIILVSLLLLIGAIILI